MDREQLTALLDELDGPLLAGWWEARRWEIQRAIERHGCDLTAIEQLVTVLGGDLRDLDDRQDLQEARRAVRLLDALMLRERVRPTGLFLSPAWVRRLCVAVLSMEVRYRPDERGWFSELRIRLTQMAERREIDLRGLDV